MQGGKVVLKHHNGKNSFREIGMHEEMIAYIRQHGPVSSQELAERFLKFKSPLAAMAHAAIKGILAADKRCCFGDDGLWCGAAVENENAGAVSFSTVRVIAVYLLSSSRESSSVQGGKPIHVSAWTVEETPQLLHDVWITDPELLPQDEQEVLRSVRDRPFALEYCLDLLSLCENSVPVFMCSRDLALFSEAVAPWGGWPEENALVVPALMNAASIPVVRPLTLDACYRALFAEGPVLSYAYKYGECLAQCVRELIVRLEKSGIRGTADLEEAEKDGLSSFDFSQKEFSREDIANAPAQPGVYGFKAKGKDFLYIGKAANLRRRLVGYFRKTDESPEKISRIRAESHGLITSVCGSELEGLIYEYRLIKKHRPVLNTQVFVNERKGDFQPIDDCIILLPHADADKGMSFWFRKNQKILLRPFFSDFRDGGAIIAELSGFFFGAAPKPQPEDFPEQEIATRWVKKHSEGLPVVFINRVTNAKETCDAMRSLWKDFRSGLSD
jgi:hypothetical protein